MVRNHSAEAGLFYTADFLLETRCAALPEEQWMPGGGAGLPMSYHTSQRSSFARTMVEPGLQLKAFWNSGMFDSGPMTRYLPMG
jgi:hypothetical protein